MASLSAEDLKLLCTLPPFGVDYEDVIMKHFGTSEYERGYEFMMDLLVFQQNIAKIVTGEFFPDAMEHQSTKELLQCIMQDFFVLQRLVSKVRHRHLMAILRKETIPEQSKKSTFLDSLMDLLSDLDGIMKIFKHRYISDQEGIKDEHEESISKKLKATEKKLKDLNLCNFSPSKSVSVYYNV